MFETVYRRGLVLPRVSAGGLLLAFALAAVLATAVGVSAWSFARASGASPAQVAALRHAAYEQGLQAGSRQATTSAVAHARTVALASGRKLGYRRGLKAGFARGKARRACAGNLVNPAGTEVVLVPDWLAGAGREGVTEADRFLVGGLLQVE